jgi:hypothetical protein
MRRSDVPPRSKKLSSAPMPSKPSAARQASRTTASVPLNAAPSAWRATIGSGRRARSILPFGLSGNSSNATAWAGIMCSGSLPRSASMALAVSRVAADGAHLR